MYTTSTLRTYHLSYNRLHSFLSEILPPVIITFVFLKYKSDLTIAPWWESLNIFVIPKQNLFLMCIHTMFPNSCFANYWRSYSIGYRISSNSYPISGAQLSKYVGGTLGGGLLCSLLLITYYFTPCNDKSWGRLLPLAHKLLDINKLISLYPLDGKCHLWLPVPR